MLKLVDGTELTAEVKEAFKRGVTNAYIKLEDGRILSSKNYLKTLTLEDLRYNEETDNIIGEATSKRVTIGLYNQKNALDVEDREFELLIGTKLSEYEENNFYNIDDIVLMSKDMKINDDDSVTATFDNTEGTEAQYLNLFANVAGFLGTSSNYVAILEILDISGTGSFTITDSSIELESFSNFSAGTAVKYNLKSLDSFLNSNTVLKTYVKFNPGESGTITFRISILENNINLNNFEYNKYNHNNKYISFGKYVVQKPENNDTKESTELEAFDYMCKFNQTYVPGVQFPCTYADLAEDVCNQCGVELGNRTFRNADKLVYENFFIDGEQCRVVVKEIAKIAFSWARVATDNKLYFDFAKKDIENADELFTLDDYIELEKNEETIPVNTIILSNSVVDSENITIKDDALIAEYGQQKELVVKEDYFAYSQEKRQELIEAARELMGLVYNPITVKSIGTIYLESNDIIVIEDKQGNKKGTYCFNHTIDFNGVLYDKIESPSMTETQTKYQHESSEDLSRRRTEILVNKATQEVKILAEKVDTYDTRISSIELDLDKIEAKIESEFDITRTVDGLKSITLENCMAGELLELHINGNNTVFDYLMPSDNLLPSDILLPYGDSLIKVTHQKLDDEGNIIEETSEIIDLGIKEVLRQQGDVYDTYDLVNNKASITRRIGVAEDGTLYVLNEPIVEDLGELIINLIRGTNIIEIINYSAMLTGRYIIINNYTETFTTTVELKAALEILYNQINLEVSKKVGNEEIIARINMAVLGKDEAEIPEDIEKSIIEILANKISIKSDYFELTKDGRITATEGNIASLIMSTNEEGNSWLFKNSKLSDGRIIQNGLHVAKDSNGNNVFLYAGVDVTHGSNLLANANTYITEEGLIKAKWFEVNGESGYFIIRYDSGRRAVQHSIDGSRYYVNDDANGFYGFIGCYQGDMRIDLNDSLYFKMRDNLHQDSNFFEMITFGRHDPNSSGNTRYRHCFDFKGSIWCFGIGADSVNNTIYIQGYEVQTSASDERLKDNIADCKENALDIINAIPMITFDWKKDTHRKDAGKNIKVGYGAQRTQKVYENAVIYDEANDTYQMDLLNLSALHTKAIQELTEENKKLKKMVNFLAEKLGCMEEMEEMLNGESDKLV